MLYDKHLVTKTDRIKDRIGNITCIMLCLTCSFFLTRFILHKMDHAHHYIDIYSIFIFLISCFIIFSLETFLYLGIIIKKSKKK